MKVFTSKLLAELEEHLIEIDLQKESTIQSAENAIKVTIVILEKLKTFSISHTFENKGEEINFFKIIKPQFVSRLIYYNEIHNIESNKPFGTSRHLRKYFNAELDKLKIYFNENLDFYKYFRTGNTVLDKKYFLRGRYDIKLTLDSSYFQADNRFTTSHDFKVAKIIANDQIKVYLENEVAKLDAKPEPYKISERHIQKWTGSKIALIELIYALHAEGVFNNGTTDLKETAKFFEETFDIDLGQFHRTFFEMRARKSERTKFLNSLRDTLVRRMDEVDEI
jgi:hypothetical protein